MSSDSAAFAETVRQRLDELETSPFAIETAMGLPPDAIRNVLRGVGKSGPTYARIREICDAIGLEFYVGPRRDTGMIQTMTVTTSAHETLEYVPVPLHEALLAAGNGARNGETIIDQIAFRRDWLKRIGLPASAARLARVTGDSMEPTLFEGDLVLIDTTKIEPQILKRDPRDRRRSPIYALADAGGARVKRIERPEQDQLMLLSDNTDYPPELLHGPDLKDMKIIGRVVWWGHTVKE